VSERFDVPTFQLGRLSRAVTSWLHYEFLCQRGRLFSESYLKNPIASFIQANTDLLIHSEVSHPKLSRKLIDFVASRKTESQGLKINEIEIAIETKWFYKSATKEQILAILWDILRLSLIKKHNSATMCLFIIFAEKKIIEEIYESKHFKLRGKDKNLAPLLTRSLGKNPKIKLNESEAILEAVEKIKKKFKCGEANFPNEIITNSIESTKFTEKSLDYRLYIWEIEV
jgi:hypothetical protein